MKEDAIAHRSVQLMALTARMQNFERKTTVKEKGVTEYMTDICSSTTESLSKA